MPNENIVFRFDELHHTFRHTANNQVLTVKLHCSVMESRGKRCIGGKTAFNLFYQLVFTKCHHEFFHIHRIQRYHVNFANRKRELLSVYRNTKQAASNNNVIVRCVFAEIFKRS